MDFQEIFQNCFSQLEKEVQGKVVVDVPAGRGKTSEWLKNFGARVYAFDLLPQFFKVPGLECQYCNLDEKIPLANHFADIVISQEGIEHLTNQVHAFKEFSRILKINGKLIVTCPNGSSLTSKVSRLFGECERYNRLMAPNLVDSIWFKEDENDKIYFGHLFIPTATQLRLFALIQGFHLEKIYFSELKISNLFWMILFYPFILVSQTLNFMKNKRKYPYGSEELAQVFRLSINPKVLVDGSLVMEFVKVDDPDVSLRKILARRNKS